MKDSSGERIRRSSTPFRLVRWVLRGALLLLVLALVAGLGLVIGGHSKDTPPLTFSEAALDRAYRSTAGLSETASLLAAEGHGETYRAVAELLAQQAEALRPPSPASSSSSPAPTEPVDSASATTATAVPASEDEFLAALTASYTANLTAAGEAEAGTARLLASVGTGQWLQARHLAGLRDLDRPGPPSAGTPNGNDDGGEDGGQHDDGGEDGGQDGGHDDGGEDGGQDGGHDDGGGGGEAHPDTAAPECGGEQTPLPDSGLSDTRSAVFAEHQAAYAYEVAAARAEDPALLLALSGEHGEAAQSGGLVLKAGCIAVPTPAAAFALDPDFFGDPEESLRGMELDLVETYADLVGLTEDSARRWALDQLLVSGLRADDGLRVTDPSSGLGPFPGIDDAMTPPLDGA